MIDLIPFILEHLVIVLVATGISVVIGIVLGIVAYWLRFTAQPILWFSEAVQTIPALALLAILMILFGLGKTTIIAGLTLYALLPIVRNTHTGLILFPPQLRMQHVAWACLNCSDYFD